MRSFGLIRRCVLALAMMMLVPAVSHAGVVISVGFAPPVLPVYTQPLCPGEGYLWTPGYWAYSPAGYYWVPGVWVQPPAVGLLWTPPYWGWGGSAFIFHEGYWGPHVGFYGGVNYGFGYGGVGFVGGRWVGGRFAYNTAIVNVNTAVIHNTYLDRTVINRGVIGNRVSYNGGAGGLQARPSAQEAAFARESHVGPTATQQSHFTAARNDRGNLASVNGGRPQVAAARTTGDYHNAVQQRGGFGSGQQSVRSNAAQPQANRGNVNAAASRPQAEQHTQAQAQQHTQEHAQVQQRPQGNSRAEGEHGGGGGRGRR